MGICSMRFHTKFTSVKYTVVGWFVVNRYSCYGCKNLFRCIKFSDIMLYPDVKGSVCKVETCSKFRNGEIL